jgi:hypothetical protein
LLGEALRLPDVAGEMCDFEFVVRSEGGEREA